jgi:hypothetical protein
MLLDQFEEVFTLQREEFRREVAAGAGTTDRLPPTRAFAPAGRSSEGEGGPRVRFHGKAAASQNPRARRLPRRARRAVTEPAGLVSVRQR